jgi:phosphoglycerate dehydrogenase-like enzyme
MPTLILDDGIHINGPALSERVPGEIIFDTRKMNDAMEKCADCDILVAMAHEVTDELVGRMPKLRYICAMSAGIERLQTLKNLKPDVLATSGRGIHGPQMSEIAFLSMISLSRDFSKMQRNQAKHLWDRWPQKLLWRKTVVLVGIGPIAEELAARCVAFGMRVIGVSDARAEAPNFDAMMPRADLTKAVAQGDFVIVLVPLSPQTRHMIGKTVFDAMKKTGVVINLARGPVVDEKALVAALQSGRIGGAALDVFEVEPLPPESPLWDMPNVIITPRVGGMSDVYTEQVLPLVAHNLRCFREGRLAAMTNVVRL